MTSTNTTAHTAGPWTVVSRTDILALQGTPESIVVASTQFFAGEPTEQQIADARLIAAAPDLLEALKECRDELFKRIDVLTANMPEETRQTYLQFPPILKADAAIAKVEGRDS